MEITNAHFPGMPFQGDRPEISASALACAASAAAQGFYSERQAAVYTTPANAGIQRDLTRYALEMAQALAPLAAAASPPVVLLDLGAGSGLSTRAASQWLDARGLASFCVAFDISASMLLLTTTSETGDASETVQVLADGKKVITSVDCGTRTAFFCGNAAQRFPLRARSCDVAIGVSMLQWLTDDGMRTCYTSLMDVLHDNSAAVFQVYPTTHEQVSSMETIALDVGFAYAEVVVGFPHSSAGKKWFLVLQKKKTSTGAEAKEAHSLRQRDEQLCPFGRRHQRRCAWHLFEHCESNTSASVRERLGREHVKEAWHIWRKFHRAESLAKLAAETGKPLHFKAKRSLELWKSDEIIGEVLRERYVSTSPGNDETNVGDSGKTAKLTHEFLLARMDDVVQVLHSAYTKAVALERSLVPQSDAS